MTWAAVVGIARRWGVFLSFSSMIGVGITGWTKTSFKQALNDPYS